MEYQSNADYLTSLRPPKLEDAGLEDCALPLEGIQNVIKGYNDFLVKTGADVLRLDKEAFRLAAEKARSAADSLKEVINTKGFLKDEGSCVPNSDHVDGDLEDAAGDIIGLKGEGGSCVETETGGLLEEGKDTVVDPMGEVKEDKLVGGIDVGSILGGDGCLQGDPLEHVGMPGASSSGSYETEGSVDEEPEGPILTGDFL